MVRPKKLKTSFNVTERNRIYLEMAGVLDGRTGHSKLNTRKGPGTCAGDIINECITLAFENRMIPRSRALSEAEVKRRMLEMEQMRFMAQLKPIGDRIRQIGTEIELMDIQKENPFPSPPNPLTLTPEQIDDD